MNSRFAFSVSVAATALLAGAAQATPITISLPGTTQFDGWGSQDLSSTANPGYGGFPGTSAWPGPISSAAAGSGDAELVKVSNGAAGGPYPASGSVYFGGFSSAPNTFGGTLAVVDSTPVANLANVVLQIDIAEAYTYDFFNHALPTLSYNGGSQNLAADTDALVERIFTGTVTMPTGEEPVYRNTWLLQWDLSAISTPITEVAVTFSGVQHAQMYALQLDQSDNFQAVAVPEPASLGVAGISAAGLLRRRRNGIA